jgi:pimeloyl-ACP methyl ester carboxylesterase
MSADTIWLSLLGAEVRYYQGKYRTRAIEAGTGEPLILIHGVGGHAEAYSRNVLQLSRHFHVYAIDLIWHGLSEKPPFPMEEMNTIPMFVEHVEDFMNAAGIDAAHVEGESLGGWVGGRLALSSPKRVRKLIMNTTAGWNPPGMDTAPGLAERSMAAIRDPDRETIRKRLEWLMATPDRVTDELVEVRYRYYSDPETRQALENLFHAHLVDQTPRRRYSFSEEDLGTIAVPTLVLWSEHNPGTGPDVGRHIAGLIPSAQFVSIADASHWPQWEKPEEHDEIVTRFLLRGA